MQRWIVGTCLLLSLLMLSGCGGSHPAAVATGGRVSFTLQWPARTRLIPLAANSVKITLSQNGAILASQILARPAAGGQATATFGNLPIGVLTATASAYPQADGTGVMQATASMSVTTVGGQVTQVHLTMASTVTAVTIPAGQSVSVGQTQPLQFTATDAGGNVVIVSNAEASILIVSGAGNVKVSGGQVQGVKRGSATLILTVEGVTSPAQAVSVTPQIGTVWGWGYNADGELGTGATTGTGGTGFFFTAPTHTLFANITAVAESGSHTLALASDGTVWATGNNSYGQLGTGTHDSNVQTHPTPIQVSGLNNAVAVAAAHGFSVALKSDGTVWAWGFPGDIGDGTTLERDTPVQVSGLSNVVAIAASSGAAFALKQDGTVWAWGYNQYGDLGDGTTTNRLTPVQTQGLPSIIAMAGSLALASDGTVWAWGSNQYGQLGNGTQDNNPHPIPSQVPGLSNVVAISDGGGTAMVVKSDGTVWGWGINGEGPLGDGTLIDRLSPVQATGITGVTAVSTSGVHTLALKSDGTVWATGRNDAGNLGDGTTTLRMTFVQTQTLSTAIAVIAGGNTSLALTTGPDRNVHLPGVTKAGRSVVRARP